MSVAKVTDVTVANGGTTSRWVNNDYEGGEAQSFTLYAKAAVAGTFTIEVTHVHTTSPAAGDIVTLQIGGTDAAPPAASKAKVMQELAEVTQWRIKASAPVGADMTWGVTRKLLGYP